MSATQRNLVVWLLVILSIVCGICFALLLGSFLHTGQQAVGAFSGVGTAPAAPSAGGYVALVLTALGTWLGGSWAKWFAMAANAAPTVEKIASAIPQLQGLTAKIKASPLSSIVSLVETLDIGGNNAVTSKGEHAIPGGKVEWTIVFTPAAPVQ